MEGLVGEQVEVTDEARGRREAVRALPSAEQRLARLRSEEPSEVLRRVFGRKVARLALGEHNVAALENLAELAALDWRAHLVLGHHALLGAEADQRGLEVGQLVGVEELGHPQHLERVVTVREPDAPPRRRVQRQLHRHRRRRVLRLVSHFKDHVLEALEVPRRPLPHDAPPLPGALGLAPHLHPVHLRQPPCARGSLLPRRRGTRGRGPRCGAASG